MVQRALRHGEWNAGAETLCRNLISSEIEENQIRFTLLLGILLLVNNLRGSLQVNLTTQLFGLFLISFDRVGLKSAVLHSEPYDEKH